VFGYLQEGIHGINGKYIQNVERNQSIIPYYAKQKSPRGEGPLTSRVRT
jgi:hypothetical protein